MLRVVDTQQQTLAQPSGGASPLQAGLLMFSPEEAIRFGWQTTKANLGFLLGVTAVVVGITIASSIIEGLFEEDSPMLSVFIQLISSLVQIIVSVGVIKISLSLVDKKSLQFSDLFPTDIALLGNFFLASVLYTLLAGLGFLLLVIPGVYFSVKYQFYQYFVVDKNVGPIQSGKMSAQITKGIKMKLLLFWSMLVGLNILGALALGVGLLVTMPISMIATAHVYRTLSSRVS